MTAGRPSSPRAGLWGVAGVSILTSSVSAPLMAAIAAPALAIAFWRTTLATVLIAPVAWGGRRDARSIGTQSLRVSTPSGLVLAAHFAAWLAALQMTSVASAIALVSTHVLWVVLIERVRGQRPSRLVLVGCLVALAGVFVTAGVDVGHSNRALVGDLLAVLGGFLWATYVTAGGVLRATLSTATYSLCCYSVCSLSLLVAAWSFHIPLLGFAARDWFLIVIVTVLAQMLGHTVINFLLAAMSPVVITLISLIQVPAAAVLAAAFLGEELAGSTWFGLGLILAGLAIVTWRRGSSPA